MHLLKIILTILVLGLIQVTGVELIKFNFAYPNILLICVLFFSLKFGKTYGLLVGIFCGFFLDLFTRDGRLIYTFLLALFGVILSTQTKRIYYQNKILQIILGFFSYICIYVGYGLISGLIMDGSIFYTHLKNQILPSGLYTSILTPIIFFLLNKIFLSSTKH